MVVLLPLSLPLCYDEAGLMNPHVDLMSAINACRRLPSRPRPLLPQSAIQNRTQDA